MSMKPDGEKVIYDLLKHNGSTAIDIMPYSKNLGLHYESDVGQYKAFLDLRHESGTVVASRDEDQLHAYLGLVDICKDRDLLPELFMEIEHASRDLDTDARQWWEESVTESMKHNQPLGADRQYTPFDYLSDDGENEVDDRMQQLEIVEDASDIDTSVDFETEMFQLAVDSDTDTARVLDYIPEEETVDVYFRLPDESIAKYSYDKPDSKFGPFIDLINVATIDADVPDSDVTLETVELLVDSVVPVTKMSGDWYVRVR